MPVCCPQPTYLASIATSVTACKLDVGQVLRYAFWRTGNKFTTLTGLTTQASWTTFLTATGSTKMAITPILENVVFEGGESREVGSGNEVPFGIPYNKGRNPIKVTAEITGAAQSVIANLKKLECEDLDVMFVTEQNKIGFKSDTDGYGFRVRSVFVSDLMPGGYSGKDHNKISFYLEPDWSDKFALTAQTTFALTMVNT